MKSLVRRLYRAVRRRMSTGSNRPTVELPADLNALLPGSAGSSGRYTYHGLAAQLRAAVAKGVPVRDLQPILRLALQNKMSPDAPQKTFAAKFCALSHQPEEAQTTFDILEESHLSQCPASLTKLAGHLPQTPEDIEMAARLAMSSKGKPSSQRAAFAILVAIGRDAPDAAFPIEALRAAVIRIMSLPGSVPQTKASFARLLCGLPHSPEQALKTITQLETVASFELTDQLRMLIARLQITEETDRAPLLDLALHSRVEHASFSRLITLMLDVNMPLPDHLIAVVKDGRPLSVMGYSRILHWLRAQDRFSDVDAVLKHARTQFPEVSAFAFLEIAQTKDGERVLDIDTLVGNITNNRSFHKHLSAIYGPYTSLVPALKRDTHEMLFAAPEGGADVSNMEQAEVLAGTAALLVTQMSRLAGLRFGQPRETTALHDWGSANYEDWLKQSAKVANTARMLLDAALELAPECLLALKTRAELLTQFAHYDEAAATWEAYLAAAGERPADMKLYLKSLCQVDRQQEAARLATQTRASETSYTTAHYVTMASFSGCHATTDFLDAVTASVAFRAVRGTEIRAVTQPVTYDPIGLHKLRDVRLVGTQVIGPADDALAYDERFEIVNLQAGKKQTSPGQPFCGLTGLIYDDAASHETIKSPIAALPGLPSMFQSYYHAVIQNLGRLPWLIQQGLLEGRQLALPDTAPEWVKQIIWDFGITKEQIMTINPDVIYHAQDVMIPTPPRMVGVPNPVLLATLRQSLGVSDAPPKDGRRLFWSRKSANNYQRALTNEDQLRQIALAEGFEEFDPVGLSIHEQVKLLGETSIVAGATGGAFANLVFGPPGLKAICMAPRQSAKNYYPLLSADCQQDYIWVLGEYLNEGYHGRGFPQLPFRVDPDTFAAALAAANLDAHRTVLDQAAAAT